MNGIFCLVTRHNTARINLIVCNVCPPAPLYLDLYTSDGVLYLGLIVVCEADLHTCYPYPYVIRQLVLYDVQKALWRSYQSSDSLLWKLALKAASASLGYSLLDSQTYVLRHIWLCLCNCAVCFCSVWWCGGIERVAPPAGAKLPSRTLIQTSSLATS